MVQHFKLRVDQVVDNGPRVGESVAHAHISPLTEWERDFLKHKENVRQTENQLDRAHRAAVQLIRQLDGNRLSAIC